MMKMMKKTIITMSATIALGLFSLPAMAAERSVTLSVDNMTCKSCPYQVSRALRKVGGVKRVKVTLADKKARVVYDDARTNVSALTRATAKAGYPSRPAR
jgi:mercuric ion binding protein